MAILIERLYRRFIPNGKNCGEWYALVRCDDCGKERGVRCRSALDGFGNKFCFKCAFKSERHPRNGAKHSKETKQKISHSHQKLVSPLYKNKGKEHPNFGKESKLRGRRRTPETIAKFSGKNSSNWNPLLTDQERQKNKEGRNSLEDVAFKKAVLRRDKYICQICNLKEKNIFAHHLDGYNWCLSKRHDVNNGVCLCEYCHTLFHNTYWFGNNTKEQFSQFKDSILKGYC